MDPHTQRAEAERWLGIAAKLLTARDFLGSKTFAIRAREADPNNAVSDQILAVVDTVLAGEKRVNSHQQPDWYQVLQLPRLVRDPDLIADHYRRLVLCLNPERNRFPFADYALQMVMEAWSVLSDPTKKWLFDNELALYLQQGEPVVTGAAATAVGGSGSGTAAAVAAGGGNSGGGSQLNTFQFFQPQPLPPQQPPQQQQQHPQQQQQQHQQHHQQQQQQQQQPMWQQPQQQQQQQQINQREFMPLPIQPQQQQQQHPPQQQQQQPPQQQQQHPPQQQQLPPQWQMRDPNPSKGGGGGVERSKGVLNGIGIGARVATTASPMIPTQTTHRQIPPFRPPSPPLPAVSAVPVVSVPTAIPIVDGNAGTAPTSTNDINISINNNNNDITINGAATNAAAANNENNDEYVVEDVDDDDDVVEDVESFWTACPYCFYIYEYPKVYQECTLRCQTCRKGFHAVQIPNPPPISPANNGGVGGGKNEKEKEKEKGKDNSFCCWGFFPLGFSMTAWKKQNQAGNLNGASNWVPFSPMFNCPVENGGGGFQWFDKNDGNANVGPTHAVTKNTPRVYIDDDDILEVSEPSDLDSSDDDWRTYNQEKNKSKNKNKKRRGRSGVLTRGRLRRDGLNQVKQNVASGGGVSVGGEHLDDGSDGQLVIGLAADKSDTGKAVNASLTRKQTRRSKKDVGRLDLNVEFNNDGEEHAPTVSAVNGEEDGIEFFEGLDEFLSTLPILNVTGDEKAKPS